MLGGLSKPRPVKSVIGLFRRESIGSGDAGSDPMLAGQLSVEMQTAITRTPISSRAIYDRRSTSLCNPSCVIVLPIAETSEQYDNADNDAGTLVGVNRANGDGDSDDRDIDEQDSLCALSRAIGERICHSNNADEAFGISPSSGLVTVGSPSMGGLARGHYASPYAVTASHRRNVRRGSMLELNG